MRLYSINFIVSNIITYNYVVDRRRRRRRINDSKRTTASKYQSITHKCVTLFFSCVRGNMFHIMLIYAMSQDSAIEITARNYKRFLAVLTNEDIIHYSIILLYYYTIYTSSPITDIDSSPISNLCPITLILISSSSCSRVKSVRS